MKFVHAVIFDKDEYKYLCELGVDFKSWESFTDGDYVVHCLYAVEDQQIIFHEDNTHAPIETMIGSFFTGYVFANSTNVGGLMIPNEGLEVDITRAYIVVDNGCVYSHTAVSKCLMEGDYVEVIY